MHIVPEKETVTTNVCQHSEKRDGDNKRVPALDIRDSESVKFVNMVKQHQFQIWTRARNYNASLKLRKT